MHDTSHFSHESKDTTGSGYSTPDEAIRWIERAGVPVSGVKQLKSTWHVEFPHGSITFRETEDAIEIEGLGRSTRGIDRRGRGLATLAVKALVAKALHDGKVVRAISTGGAVPYWSGNLGFRSGPNQTHVMDREQFDKIRNREIEVYGFGEFNPYGMQPWTDLTPEFYGPQSGRETARRSAKEPRPGHKTDTTLYKYEVLGKQKPAHIPWPVVDFYSEQYIRLFGKPDFLKESWEGLVARVHSEWQKHAPATKAVDATGKARILFHAGGTKTPGSFRVQTDRYKVGFWCTSDIRVAAVFGKRFYAVFLRMQNPFVVDAGQAYYYHIPTPDELKRRGFTKLNKVDSDILADFAWKQGYDGLIIHNVLEGSGAGFYSDVYVTFDQHNIVPLSK